LRLLQKSIAALLPTGRSGVPPQTMASPVGRIQVEVARRRPAQHEHENIVVHSLHLPQERLNMKLHGSLKMAAPNAVAGFQSLAADCGAGVCVCVH